MVAKLAAGGLLAMALLQAQEPADVEREFFEREFFARADEALGVHLGAVIADIGTGNTLTHPLRLGEKVGFNGKVVCVDVRPSVIANIKEQVASHHLTNIEAVLGMEDDPLLTPATFDGILISNAYHEFTQPSIMLKHIYEALKPDGRLVMLELYSNAHKGDGRAEQVKRHDLSPDILARELAAAGFVIKVRTEAIPLSLNGDRCRCLFRVEKSK
jgi:ubiquinone/menaquinone biosynthesis C-methylase UbiE